MPKIDARKAAEVAAAYYSGVSGDSVSKLTIEEVELEPNGNWSITLGIDENPFYPMVQGSANRKYKCFEIDGNSGEVRSMKIKSFK